MSTKLARKSVKSSGRLLLPLPVKLQAWGTSTVLPATTKIRDIKRSGTTWFFAAYDKASDTWTACHTKQDLGAALGDVPVRQ